MYCNDAQLAQTRIILYKLQLQQVHFDVAEGATRELTPVPQALSETNAHQECNVDSHLWLSLQPGYGFVLIAMLTSTLLLWHYQATSETRRRQHSRGKCGLSQTLPHSKSEAGLTITYVYIYPTAESVVPAELDNFCTFFEGRTKWRSRRRRRCSSSWPLTYSRLMETYPTFHPTPKTGTPGTSVSVPLVYPCVRQTYHGFVTHRVHLAAQRGDLSWIFVVNIMVASHVYTILYSTYLFLISLLSRFPGRRSTHSWHTCKGIEWVPTQSLLLRVQALNIMFTVHSCRRYSLKIRHLLESQGRFSSEMTTNFEITVSSWFLKLLTVIWS